MIFFANSEKCKGPGLLLKQLDAWFIDCELPLFRLQYDHDWGFSKLSFSKAEDFEKRVPEAKCLHNRELIALQISHSTNLYSFIPPSVARMSTRTSSVQSQVGKIRQSIRGISQRVAFRISFVKTQQEDTGLDTFQHLRIARI